jgi:hypothetical protein
MGVADTGGAARGVADTGAAAMGVADTGAATPGGASAEHKGQLNIGKHFIQKVEGRVANLLIMTFYFAVVI